MKGYALITGGSKGIGKALVLKFLEEGYAVLTCARGEENLALLQSECDAQFGQGLLTTVACDLSLSEGRNVLVKSIKNMDKPIRILINNTGIYIPGELYKEEEGTLEHLMATNVYSAYHVTRMVVGDMINKKEGSIFNICSTASIKAYPNGGAYSVTKFALLGYSKCLREELKESNIKVTAVLPGPVFTPSWDGVDIPEERFISAEDVAKTIWDTFQLSDRAVVEELLIRPQLGDL